MIKNKYLNLIIRISIFFSGLFISISILFSNEQLPNSLFLLPIIYSTLILSIPSFTKYMFENIGLFALNMSMILRYLISPLLISLNGISYSKSMLPSVESFNLATNLMLYELIIIFFVFQLTYKKFYFVESVGEIKIKEERNVVGWLFVGFCILLTLVYPEILSRYTFVFTADQLKSKALQTDIASTIPLLFQLGIITLTISLFNVIYKKYKIHERYRYVLVAMLIVLVTSSFVMGTSRFSVVLPLITGLYMIFLLFKKYRKSIGLISIIAILFVVIVSSVLKSDTINTSNSSDSFVSDLNDNLQLYFSGINNVAIAVETSSIYEPFNFDSIFSDITRSVVLINSFFQNDKSALVDFNDIFYSGGLSRDQILPMVGQGFLYFGFLLSPAFSVIILLSLMYFDSKQLRTESIFIRYIYAYIALKFGLFMMANFTILLSFLTNSFLILLVMFKTNNLLINVKIRKANKEVSYEHR